MTDTNSDAVPHRLYEDVLALLTGTMLVALGLVLYTQAGLITGSSAGLALLIQYVTGYGFGAVFFVINLPFYYLAVKRMGWPFALRTFAAVALISVLSKLTPDWIGIGQLNPLYAAIAGGGLMGMGLLVLFRHRAGLGGFNILALYLQDNYGIRAGYFQLGVDLTILIVSLFYIDLDKVALSVVGAAVLNLIIAINHRPGRYVGMS
ncbi:YitT family protein [Aminobacter sp. AP02]|uniref:YitT family protein n=1 Tax=Aminobacter sp. AP02 TaxID=2135737 RepID=UPI000D6CFF21|nr:YitT family protein [Aminobacter sp. AP02]PWK75700.1 putative 5xTM membrane YitT family protein [Aminobacter sp. AP02]